MVRCPREWRREALRFLKVGGVVSRADLSRRLVRCCWLRFPPNGSFCCLLSSSHLFARRYTSHVTHRIGQRTRRNKLRFREEVATSVGYVVAAATTTANAFETCSRAHVRSASAWGQAFFFFVKSYFFQRRGSGNCHSKPITAIRRQSAAPIPRFM